MDPDNPTAGQEPLPHYAEPPTHQCRACHQPWPCDQAQLDLVTEFYGNRTGLATYLSACMVSAITDRRKLGESPDVEAMYARYLSWLTMVTRPRRPEIWDPSS